VTRSPAQTGLVAGEPAPLDSTSPADAGSQARGRLDVVIPILLAALGLAAALIAWRASGAAGAAGAADGAGLAAARLRASALIVDEGLTSRTLEAYTDYERLRRRGDLLARAELDAQAQLARMEATSHWFLVYPEYLDRSGAFQANLQRAALLAGDEGRLDLRPQPHFEIADAETARVRSLMNSGMIIALALPFLTLAEIGRGRLRSAGTLIGAGLLAIGAVAAAVSWL
jgi:hypothetical protein